MQKQDKLKVRLKGLWQMDSKVLTKVYFKI